MQIDLLFFGLVRQNGVHSILYLNKFVTTYTIIGLFHQSIQVSSPAVTLCPLPTATECSSRAGAESAPSSSSATASKRRSWSPLARQRHRLLSISTNHSWWGTTSAIPRGCWSTSSTVTVRGCTVTGRPGWTTWSARRSRGRWWCWGRSSRRDWTVRKTGLRNSSIDLVNRK